MKWVDIIDRTLLPFESRKGQLDIRAGKYLDEAMEDFSLYTKCHVRKFNIYISTDKTFITLPDDFVEMVDTPVFRGRYLDRRASNAYLFNQDTATNRFNTGTPQEYYLEDRRLHLIPRPSQAGVLTLTYIAVPKSLRGKTDLKKVRFDNLVSEFFRPGNDIKSRPGASNTTSTIGKIEVAEHHEPLGGSLIISGVTNGFTTDNEDLFSANPETGYWETLHGSSWSSITTTWNNLGFGGIATINGVQFSYTEEEPVIPSIYHYALVDYAKAMIHQDMGNLKAFNNHYTLYVASREKARTTSANSDSGGMTYVADRVANGSM